MSGKNLLASDFLETCRARVDAELDRCITRDSASGRLQEAMRYSVLGGGKRIRPALCLAAAKAMGQTGDEALIPACSVELIHAYSLIHDDLPAMDDDELRRGRPTTHIAFDEATAILAGDALQALAFGWLAEAPGLSESVRLIMVRELARASGHDGMAGGQMMDIVSQEENYDLRQITRLQQLKTGALLAASVEMGAVLGRVPPEGRAHLRAYARDIGLAFQIADDLLDVEGDEAKAGKALRKDEEQGKQTFVTLMGVEQARAQATMLVEQAGRHLSSYGEDARLLVELADFVVKRDH